MHKSSTAMTKKRKYIILAVVAAAVICLYLTCASNPLNSKNIGQIPTPAGYRRIQGDDTAYTAFLRALPLKHAGSLVRLHTGKIDRYLFLSAAVVDLPVISEYEQCADVCMRLRAEYLWQEGRYGEIKFLNVFGKTDSYPSGASRAAFEAYITHIFTCCNTASLSNQLETRKLGDMQPGDVFVYPARQGKKYGHAVMVVDVARNKRTGKKAFLLAEGNTPARDIHILRNLNPFSNPWFFLDEDAEVLHLNVFTFKADELKHF